MGWLCVAGAGAALFCWTLPVSLYFTLCMLALVGASRLTQEWRSAAYAVLIPACVGFGLLLLAIPVFYFLTPIEDFTAVHFSWVDRKLVEVHRILEPQSTEAAKAAQPFDFLGWVFQHLDGLRWTFLLLLLPLSCLCSQVRRVSAALRVRRTLAAVVSTLALVTSFSFVVDNNVTGPLVSRIVHDIRLKYGENIESAAHDVATGLSARAFVKAVAHADPNDLRAMAYFSEIGDRLEDEKWRNPQLFWDGDAILESLTEEYLGTDWELKQLPSGDPAVLASAHGSRKGAETLLARDPFQALRRSEVLAAAAHHFSEEQQELASKEVVKAAAAVVPKIAVHFLTKWLSDLTGVDHQTFAKLAEEYLTVKLGQDTVEEAFDTAFEKWTDPVVERVAHTLSQQLDERWRHDGTQEKLVALEPVVWAHGHTALETAHKERMAREAAHEALMKEWRKAMGVPESDRYGHGMEFRGRG